MRSVPATRITTPEYNRSLEARDFAVGSFALGRTEVTESDYAAFVLATGYFPPAAWGRGVHARRSSRLPVSDVSLVDAMYYCAWKKARLPTWAEWHAAAFGPEGQREPWRDRIGDATMARGETLVPVGNHPPSGGAYDLADLFGNAWEWCLSPLVHRNDESPQAVDLRRAMLVGGGALRMHSGRVERGIGEFVREVTGGELGLDVFWDEREGLPSTGPNQRVWGASVVSADFLCVASGGGSIWMGYPDDDARRYPRLCTAAAMWWFRSPSVGFRCAANSAGPAAPQ